MMTGKQTATVLIVWVGLAMGILVGCGTSSPEVGDAQTAFKDGRYEMALSRTEQALEKDSADTDAYLLRADVLRQMADSTMPFEEYKELHSRAREAEEQALSFDPDLREDVEAKRKQLFEREIELGKGAYNQANKKGEQDRYRRAAAFYGAAGVIQRDSARPVRNEAFSRLRVGQREPVIPVLEEYVERADTVSRKVYKILGRLYVNSNQLENATELLDRAVQAYPTDQKLQAFRLTAYNRRGNVDQVLESYRKQIEKRPDNLLYRYNYGSLLLEAERYENAIAQLERAVEIQPDHVGSQYNLGAAYMNAALARDDSIAALEEMPTTTDSTNQQIKALAQKRDSLFEASVLPLERVRQMEKTPSTIQRDACRALMVVYVQTRQPGRAAQVEKCTGFAQADL